MLLTRSIALHICLLLFGTAVRGQHYDSDYNYDSEHEANDHSPYTETDGRPDYSKYYLQPSTAPLLAPAASTQQETAESNGNGFVQPLDFSSFFAAPQFGLGVASAPQVFPTAQASNAKPTTQGFVNPADFQQAAQSAGFQKPVFGVPQQFDNFFAAQSKPAAGYATQTQHPVKPKNQYSEADDLNNYNDKESASEDKPSYNYNPPSKSLTYATSKYTPAQTTGKTAYASPAKNYSPQYYASATKHTNVQPTLTPYQKYSFQPVANLKSASHESPQSTALPYTNTAYNPNSPYPLPSTVASLYKPTADYAQATDQKSQKAKNCRKIDKQLSREDISTGRFRRGADEMNCYACDDPKTGGTIEQCSYTSDPDNAEYFKGHASKYSTVTYRDPEEEDDHRRKKRSAKDRSVKDRRNKRQKKEEQEEEEESEPYSNPFDEEKEGSHTFASKPEEFDSNRYYKSPDFSGYKSDYKYSPEYFTDATNEEKSYSERQSDELKKNAKNCKKVKKDALTCMVCTNPKTGGNYEQCSYSSEPQEKKYSYVKEKKYNSNEPTEESKEGESTEDKPVRSKSRRQKSKPSRKTSYQDDYDTYHPDANTKRQRKVKKPVESHQGYDVFHPSGSAPNENKYKGLNPDLYGQAEPSEEQAQKIKEGEDYVYKLFPEYAEKASAIKEIKRKPGFEFQSDLPEYFSAEESKKDVDSVLAEFAKKDRSNCKKVAKDKMTCFICTDEKGVQHEECMFVSESQPKSSHIAYHEVKEFTSDPKRGAENKQKETIVKAPKGIKEANKEITPAASKISKQKYPKKTATTVEKSEPNSASTAKVPRVARRKTNIQKEFLDTHKGLIQKRETTEEAAPKKEGTEESSDEIKEVEPESPDGAHASELVPVFSKKLGTTLPLYMVDVSEHEKEFDSLVSGGV